MNIEKINIQHDFENQFPKNRELLEGTEASECKNIETEIIKPDIQYIETTSAKALFEQNCADEINAITKSESINETNENKRSELTEDEKAKVKEDHPDWPDEIIDAIGSWKEYEIYDKGNLKVEYVNERPCLVRTDIDMSRTDDDGVTNAERIKRGLAPIGNDGRPINLHHIGQHKDSPLAELTATEHQDNYGTLHPYQGPTEVHGEGTSWDTERKQHWKTRANEL
jgi:hypothetical protein